MSTTFLLPWKILIKTDELYYFNKYIYQHLFFFYSVILQSKDLLHIQDEGDLCFNKISIYIFCKIRIV